MRAKVRIALLAAIACLGAAIGVPGSEPEASASCRTPQAGSATGTTAGTTMAVPPVRTDGQPTLDVFARGADDQLYHRWWVPGVWTCWQGLRGELASGAGVASHGPGILHLGVLAPDNRIVDLSFVNRSNLSGGWSNWTQLGSESFSSAPAAVSWSTAHFEMYAKGSDNRIWRNAYRFGGGGWTGWAAFANDTRRFTSAPAAVAYAPERLHVFATGEDGRIYDRHLLAEGGWSDWAALGNDRFLSGPAAVSWGDQHLEVFALNQNNKISHNWYRFGGGGWSGWHELAGDQTFAEAPAAASHAFEKLNVFALGTDGRLWQRYHLGAGTWSPWAPMGDERFTSGPAAASWSNR